MISLSLSPTKLFLISWISCFSFSGVPPVFAIFVIWFKGARRGGRSNQVIDEFQEAEIKCLCENKFDKCCETRDPQINLFFQLSVNASLKLQSYKPTFEMGVQWTARPHDGLCHAEAICPTLTVNHLWPHPERLSTLHSHANHNRPCPKPTWLFLCVLYFPSLLTAGRSLEECKLPFPTKW